jgi:hypothetical protein
VTFDEAELMKQKGGMWSRQIRRAFLTVVRLDNFIPMRSTGKTDLMAEIMKTLPKA